MLFRNRYHSFIMCLYYHFNLEGTIVISLSFLISIIGFFSLYFFPQSDQSSQSFIMYWYFQQNNFGFIDFFYDLLVYYLINICTYFYYSLSATLGLIPSTFPIPSNRNLVINFAHHYFLICAFRALNFFLNTTSGTVHVL